MANTLAISKSAFGELAGKLRAVSPGHATFAHIGDTETLTLHDVALYANQDPPITSEIICPFCQEGDFDLVGLKQHILNAWCEAFNKTIPT